jgi:electron transfer flavoprotein beta subunit
VGPGISAHLDIPQVTYVKKIEEIKDNSMQVERMTEEGFEIIQTPLPCLFTVVKEINEPRLPSLKGMLRAKQAKIITWSQKELNLDSRKIGLSGSPTQVIKIFTPPPRTGGQILKGGTEEIASQLVDLLKNEVH